MKRSARWQSTNWTFGVWWDCNKLHSIGIDIGPIEIVWQKVHKR